MAGIAGITNEPLSSLYSSPLASGVSGAPRSVGQMDSSSNTLDTQALGTESSQPGSSTHASKVVSSLNQQFASSNVKAEFASDAKSGEVWINMVDKSTGKVIFEIPSEAVRKLAEDGVSKTGLTINYAG